MSDLVHVGLETVGLSGKGFEVLKKAGDPVKKGELVAKADLNYFREQGLNPITPIVITNLPEGASVQTLAGDHKAGSDEVLIIEKPNPAANSDAAENAEKKEMKPKKADEQKASDAGADGKKKKKKKKLKINFDFLQKFGKALMVVIAVMPAAGLMISLGKLVGMMGGDISIVMTIAAVMENIGWAIINNLNLLFAIAIGGSWAKERAGGAFAAAIAFILVNNITGQIFGVTEAMLADPAATTHTLFGQVIPVDGYFVSILGAPALNMGVFVGMIAGFMGAIIYNKYYNFRKLPDALAILQRKALRAACRHHVVCHRCPDPFSDLADGSAWHQQFRYVDCDLFGDISGSGAVYLRHSGASAAAVWPASYADDSDELHFIWRNL